MEPSKLPQYTLFTKWYSLPREERKPSTLEEFCSKYTISKADLISFQDNPDFEDDMTVSTLKWAKRRTPELLHILYKKYKEQQHPQDLRLWHDLVYSEERQKELAQSQSVINIFNISDERKHQIIERIARRSLPAPTGSQI